MVHPVIRILCFLVFAGFVAFGGMNDLLLGYLLVLTVVLVKRLPSLELSLRTIKRMRWLFLSILVIYFWFTPGQPVLGGGYPYLPSVQGVQMGILRVSSLILIVLALNVFVSTIARQRLVEAIIWLFNPVSRLGLDCRSLAVRIALILELIPQVQQIVVDMKLQYGTDGSDQISNEYLHWRKRIVSRIVEISRLVELLFERIVNEAVNMHSETFAISTLSAPPLLQWGLPLSVAVLFWWLKNL